MHPAIIIVVFAVIIFSARLLIFKGHKSDVKEKDKEKKDGEKF